MPVTVEGKLELFKKVLFENIEADWAHKRNELMEALKGKKEEGIKDFEKRKLSIIEDGKNRAKLKAKSILSEVESEADDEITRKKEELLSDLTLMLRDWSREFIKSDRYKAYLQKNIEKSLHLMGGINLLFCFTQKDMEDLGSFIREETAKYEEHRNIQMAVSREDIIGGFTLEDRGSGVLADFTVKTLVEEGKEFMGKMLYEKLDEVLRT